MKFSTKKILNKENILFIVNEYQIFKYYIPDAEIGRAIQSPLRKDKNPSFGLFVSRETGEILFNDFSSGGGNIFRFVMILFGLTYREALIKINYDLELELYADNKKPIIKTKGIIITDDKPEYHDTLLKIKRRDWNGSDAKYWGQYKLSIDFINAQKETFPISHYRLGNNIFEADKHAYSLDFYHDDMMFRRKIYQPYSDYKWFSNITTNVIDGIKSIPKQGETLIITKSRKDRYVLKSLNYNVIGTNNEGSFIPEVNFNKLVNRYDRIVLFFDNDKAGKDNSIKFAERYNIEYILIPDDEPKDISDFIKKYGIDDTQDILKQLL